MAKFEAEYVTLDKKLTFKISAESTSEMVKKLAEIQEIFDDTTCYRNGKKSTLTRWRVRQEGKYKYHELYCYGGDVECMGAKKAFGQHEEDATSLFPKSKDKDGNYLPNGGFVKFNKETGKEE